MTINAHPHPHCLLCGDRNPWSFRLAFTPAPDGGVTAGFRGRAELQGYDGILHGGVVASLLDAAMTNCLFQEGVRAVTAELKVRYRHPTPWDAALEIRARVVERRPPLYRVEAEIHCQGKKTASAAAKFMPEPEPRI